MASKLNVLAPKICAGCLNFGDNLRFYKVNKDDIFLSEVYNNSNFPDILWLCCQCFYRVNKFMCFRLNVAKASTYLQSIIDDLCTGKKLNYDNLTSRRKTLRITDLSTSFVECVDTVDYVLEAKSNQAASDLIAPLALWDGHSENIKLEPNRDQTDVGTLISEIPIFETIDVSPYCEVIKNEKVNDCYVLDEESPLSHKYCSTSMGHDAHIPSTVLMPVENTSDESTAKSRNPNITGGSSGLQRFNIIVNLKEKTSDELMEEQYQINSQMMSDIVDGVQLIYRSKGDILTELQRRKLHISYEQSEFKCATCIKGYSFKDEYDRHMRLHSKNRGRHECDICQQYYQASNGLLRHLLQHYRRYKCSLCDFVKGNRALAIRHYLKVHYSHSSQECTKCGDVFLKSLSEKHVCLKTLAICHVCDKSFFKNSIKNHILLRHTERNHKCSQCEKTFPSPKLLSSHENSAHKNFYCPECDQFFNAKVSYDAHMRYTKKHTNYLKPENLKQCRHCSLKVPYNAYIAHCDKMHPVAGKYKCKVCPEDFDTRRAFNYHRRTIHRKQKVKKHICNYCGRGFTLKLRLNDHLNTHTGERPHKCKMCDDSFGAKATLYRHNLFKHKRDKRKPTNTARKEKKKETAVDTDHTLVDNGSV